VNVTSLAIPDVRLFEPKVFTDERGFFYESYNQQQFEQHIRADNPFVQDNHVHSNQGVLRGLHYQVAPMAQGKLIRVIYGTVFDVVVDLRQQSEFFGRWLGIVLSAEQHQQLWIPAGFAHGYYTLSERSECLYKTTNYYTPSAERSIAWDDPQLAIDWPLLAQQSPILSVKDRCAEAFVNADYFV